MANGQDAGDFAVSQYNKLKGESVASGGKMSRVGSKMRDAAGAPVNNGGIKAKAILKSTSGRQPNPRGGSQ